MTRPKRAALKRRLTELYVRKLKPKTQPFLVWDALQRGLAIRVQPTGARAWKCIYSHHGRPRWLHLGDAGAIGLADARTLAAEAMLAELDGEATGGFVFAGPRGGPIHGLDGAMRYICAKLGVERATPHDLRRTHGSTITALGFGRDAMNRCRTIAKAASLPFTTATATPRRRSA